MQMSGIKVGNWKLDSRVFMIEKFTRISQQTGEKVVVGKILVEITSLF